ncbi:MAG: CBS domain-containing protein [Candidatus Aminicenantes bacterium]|nr:MAG: CBS domain-containing protein [Candidatus Aminicenantes bacterium]
MKRKVSDLLKEKGNVVYSISDKAMLKDAVKRFNEKRVGALIVVNDEEEIQGIVTERDILKKLAKTEGEVKDMNVRLLMTPREELIVGTPDDEIEYMMKVMTTNRIRHIPIVGGENELKLLGVISIGDIVKTLLNGLGMNHENRLLKDYLDRAYSI